MHFLSKYKKQGTLDYFFLYKEEHFKNVKFHLYTYKYIKTDPSTVDSDKYSNKTQKIYNENKLKKKYIYETTT